MTAAYWSEDRVETLRKLWLEGLSASQIAGQLGGGVSRNAVIGKVHRLQLSGRGRLPTAPARAVKPVTASPKPIVRPAPTPARAPSIPVVEAAVAQTHSNGAVLVREPPRQDDRALPVSRKLNLIQLNERTCKWPIGDPLSEDFHFCGNEASENGPYCRYHARIAFQPASERRRLR